MKRKRSAQKFPRVSQAAFRQLYASMYGEPMPPRWKLRWIGFYPNRDGWCDRSKREIVLLYGVWRKGYRSDGETLFEVLAHEFTHLRCKGLRHGPEFNKLVRAACDEIGLPVVSHGERSLHTGLPYKTAEQRAKPRRRVVTPEHQADIDAHKDLERRIEAARAEVVEASAEVSRANEALARAKRVEFALVAEREQCRARLVQHRRNAPEQPTNEQEGTDACQSSSAS